jgi:hypothetical protein
MHGVSQTQMAGTKTQQSVSSVFWLQKSHLWCAHRLNKKEKRKKKKGRDIDNA